MPALATGSAEPVRRGAKRLGSGFAAPGSRARGAKPERISGSCGPWYGRVGRSPRSTAAISPSSTADPTPPSPRPVGATVAPSSTSTSSRASRCASASHEKPSRRCLLELVQESESALANTHDQRRSNASGAELAGTSRTPAASASGTQTNHAQGLDRRVLKSAAPDRQVGWIESSAAMGIDKIQLHDGGRNQRPFIAAPGGRVLSALRR